MSRSSWVICVHLESNMAYLLISELLSFKLGNTFWTKHLSISISFCAFCAFLWLILMDFTELIDLASERLGGSVLFANDEFFAPKENLLKQATPVFIEGKYTDLGKWMDGWESRRRRTPGFDWCLLRLGLPGIIRGVVVDTAHFKGNYPEQCSLEACAIDGLPTTEQLLDEKQQWIEI